MMSRIFFHIGDAKEKVLVWIFSLIIFIPTINYYLSFLLKANGLPTTTIPFYFCLYALVLLGYYYVVQKTLWPLIIFLMVAFLYTLTIVVWPQNMDFMFGDLFDAPYNPLYRIVFLGLPLVFIPFVINDCLLLEKPLVYLSVINNFLGNLSFWSVIIGKQQAFEYMTFAYNLLFSSCFLFAFSRERKKRILMALSFFSLVTLAFVGARGAMFCALSFFVVYFFVRKDENNLKRGLLFFLSFVVMILVYLFYVNVLEFIAEIMDYIGFDSRIVSFLMSSDFAESHGRNVLYENMLNRISESPLWGYGIFGDRVLNRDFVGLVGYAHNIFLELLIDFGILGGVLLSCTYLFACLFFLVKSRKNGFIYGMYVAILSSTFVKLLVTGSYLTEQYFYLLVGGFILVYRHCYLSTKGVMVK